MTNLSLALLAIGVCALVSPLQGQEPGATSLEGLVGSSLAAVERAATNPPTGARFIDLSEVAKTLMSFRPELVDREALARVLPAGYLDAQRDSLLECPGAVASPRCRLRTPGVFVDVDSVWGTSTNVQVLLTWRTNNVVRPDRGLWSTQWEVALERRAGGWGVVSVLIRRIS